MKRKIRVCGNILHGCSIILLVMVSRQADVTLEGVVLMITGFFALFVGSLFKEWEL